MRDFNRVWRFSNQLAAFWYDACPDLRFAQVFELLQQYHPTKSKEFSFYWEDEDWIAAIENYKKIHKIHKKA